MYRLTIILIGLAVAAGLFLLIARTRIGIQIRAGEADREMIAALGVDISKLYTLVFALGAALAGLAGALVGAIQSVQVGMGEPVLILAFVVIVIGGIGSIKGALAGALAGGDDRHAGRCVPAAAVCSLHGPGQRGLRRGVAGLDADLYSDGGDPLGAPLWPLWRERMMLTRESLLNWAMIAALLIVPLAAWSLDEPFIITLATKAAILALAGVGLNIALGLGGLISLGHAAFFGIGGYAMGILAAHAQNYEPLFRLAVPV